MLLLQGTLGLAPGGELKIEYVKIELHSLPVKQSRTQITCLSIITESALGVTLHTEMLPCGSLVVSHRLTNVTATGSILRQEIWYLVFG